MHKKQIGKQEADSKKLQDRERAMTLELDEVKAQLARRDQEAARLKQDLERQRAVAAEAEKRCDRLKTLRARLAAGSFKSSSHTKFRSQKCSRFHTIL